MTNRDDKIAAQMQRVNTPIPMPSLSVNIGLVNFAPLASVMECLADKKGFGLQSKNSTIIFDPKELVVYDFTDGQMNKTMCADETNFINYLKLAAIEHRTFISEKTCIEYAKKKSGQKKLIIENI